MQFLPMNMGKDGHISPCSDSFVDVPAWLDLICPFLIFMIIKYGNYRGKDSHQMERNDLIKALANIHAIHEEMYKGTDLEIEYDAGFYNGQLGGRLEGLTYGCLFTLLIVGIYNFFF